MIIKTLAKLLALLNSNSRAGEIGAAIAFGLWLALVPSGNLIFIALLIVLFLVRVNLGMAIVASLLLSLVVPIADPLTSSLGGWILGLPALVPAFRTLYALPIVPLTHFNDTLVMGSLVAGAILFVPVTLLGAWLVRLYRRHVHARIANSKAVKAFMATPFVQKLVGAVRQVRRVWPTAG